MLLLVMDVSCCQISFSYFHLVIKFIFFTPAMPFSVNRVHKFLFGVQDIFK